MILTGTILTWIIEIYTVLLIVRMLMSWVPLLIRGFEPRGVLAVVFEAVYTVTDPPIKFFDRLVPPVSSRKSTGSGPSPTPGSELSSCTPYSRNR